MTRVSGSKLHLLVLCQYWAQEDVAWTDSGPHDAAAVGNAFHKCVEVYINERRVPSVVDLEDYNLDTPDAHRVFQLFGGWTYHYPEFSLAYATLDRHVAAEPSFVFAPGPGRVRYLGKSIEREYESFGRRPEEIPCSLDLVVVDFVHGIKRVTVYDWKTGAQRHTEPAAINRQLRFGALCAATEHKAELARVVVAYVDEDGVREDIADIDAFDLDVTIPAEVAHYDALTRQNPAPQPGMHCTELWCPAFDACPATQTAARDAVTLATPTSTELALVPPSPAAPPVWRPMTTNAAAIEDADHAATILMRVKILEQWAKDAKAALHHWVDAHGAVPLPDGRSYAAVVQERETIHASDDAIDLLREKLGEHAGEVIKVTVTKDALEDATRAVAGPGKPRTALEREIMTGLGAMGAIRKTTFTKYETVKPRKERAA